MTAFQFNDGGRKDAGYQGDTGDCLVRAVAIAMEKPYEHVYKHVAAINKVHGSGEKTARKGLKIALVHRLMKANGWVWTPTMGIGSGCKVHLRSDELPSGRLIVRLSGHLVAVIDGTVHDIYDPSREGTRCVYGYWRKG